VSLNILFYNWDNFTIKLKIKYFKIVSISWLVDKSYNYSTHYLYIFRKLTFTSIIKNTVSCFNFNILIYNNLCTIKLLLLLFLFPIGQGWWTFFESSTKFFQSRFWQFFTKKRKLYFLKIKIKLHIYYIILLSRCTFVYNYNFLNVYHLFFWISYNQNYINIIIFNNFNLFCVPLKFNQHVTFGTRTVGLSLFYRLLFMSVINNNYKKYFMNIIWRSLFAKNLIS
jgi:hypothetical protein